MANQPPRNRYSYRRHYLRSQIPSQAAQCFSENVLFGATNTVVEDTAVPAAGLNLTFDTQAASPGSQVRMNLIASGGTPPNFGAATPTESSSAWDNTAGETNVVTFTYWDDGTVEYEIDGATAGGATSVSPADLTTAIAAETAATDTKLEELRSDLEMLGTPQNNQSVAGNAATITVAAPGTGKQIAIISAGFSYDAAASGVDGAFTITTGGGTVLQRYDVTTDGAGPLSANLLVPENEAVTIELSADANVGGNVNVVTAVRDV